MNESPPLKWYVALTRYRNEKHVRLSLERKGLIAHVPLRKVVRIYPSRKKTHFLPLINCHVFIKMDLKDQGKVLDTQGVLGFIRFSDKIAEIPDRDMEILEQVAKGDYPLDVDQGLIVEGDLVEVSAGELRGLRGHLMEIQNDKRFVLSIPSISQSISIQIDRRFLKKVEK